MSNENILALKTHFDSFNYKTFVQGSIDEISYPSVYLETSINQSNPLLNSFTNNINIQYSTRSRNTDDYIKFMIVLESFVPVEGTRLFRIDSESQGVDKEDDIFYYQISIKEVIQPINGSIGKNLLDRLNNLEADNVETKSNLKALNNATGRIMLAFPQERP